MLTFSSDIKTILGLSDRGAQAFFRAGVANIRDLLLHLPLRYEDRSRVTEISDVRDGDVIQVHARVLHKQIINGRKRMLHVVVEDISGSTLTLQFFHYYPSQLEQFRSHRWGLFYAKAVWSPYGYQLVHPEIQWLKDEGLPDLNIGLLAIYPTVKGLTQDRWRKVVSSALNQLEFPVKDCLTDLGLWSFEAALRTLHQPELDQIPAEILSASHPARQRLAFEELCAHQLSLINAKKQLRAFPAPKLPMKTRLVEKFLEQLPFQLTEAQMRVKAEIEHDLASTNAMLRLVQGDVGSGKTVIALLACLQAIAAGKQAAFMVPTELLAEQHLGSMQKLLGELPVRTLMLSSKLPAKEKRARFSTIESGEVQLIVGTHALFQEAVKYHDLALIAIDEQHRFGVQQRLALQEKAPKGKVLHQLVLTATPIPRTLAMSAYGELDTSIIDTLPAGRQPIKTFILSAQKRDKVIQGVSRICQTGKQAYWVCPLIEESEMLECENAEATAEYLQSQLPQLQIAMVHGRLKVEERRERMQAFACGEIDLLVATTVIEVGVDVANASLMVIENAERFGLSQLHQLRGRVGRGSAQSFCMLIYQAPLGQTAKRRLKIMRETNDGFLIAEEDLKIRGAGELLGTRQTGDQILKIADLERDAHFLPEIAQLTELWQSQQPSFVATLMQRWVGENTRYFRV